MSKTLPNLK